MEKLIELKYPEHPTECNPKVDVWMSRETKQLVIYADDSERRFDVVLDYPDVERLVTAITRYLFLVTRP